MYVSGEGENIDANEALKTASPGLAAQTPLKSGKWHGPHALALR